MRIIIFIFGIIIGILPFTSAQRKKPTNTPDTKQQVSREIDSKNEQYKKTALQIWEFSEVGYKETKSSTLHQEALTENGFSVQAGVAGIPTAFMATYGSGKPVIGILAEYDALPGLS